MNVKPASPPARRCRRTLLVFEVGAQRYAVSLSDVEQITAMAELDRPPGSPPVLSGFLNLAGKPVPVIRLRHLFGQPDASPELWTPLVVLQGQDRRLALLVDKVSQVLAVTEDFISPLSPGHVLNDCVEGIIRAENESILLLSPDRLLLQQEACSVAELGQLAQQRLSELEAATTC